MSEFETIQQPISLAEFFKRTLPKSLHLRLISGDQRDDYYIGRSGLKGHIDERGKKWIARMDFQGTEIELIDDTYQQTIQKIATDYEQYSGQTLKLIKNEERPL